MRLIKRPIKKKIMLGFGVVIALMIVSNAFVLIQLNNISTSAKATLTNNVTSIDLVKRLQSILIDEERNAQKFIISRDQAYYNLFTQSASEFNSYTDSLRFSSIGSDGLESVNDIVRTHNWFVSTLIDESEKSDARHKGMHDDLIQTISDSLSTTHSELGKIIYTNQAAIGNMIIAVETSSKKSLLIALVLTLGTLLLATILALFIAHTITQPIESLIAGTEKIAAGSFNSINVSSHDEIAQLGAAINHMSEQLKRVNDYKVEMIHQISHEIRTPLQTLLWAYNYLSANKAGPLTEKQIEMLAIFGKTIDQLQNYCNQFLELAKSEAGMMQYSYEQCDIVELARKLLKEIEFGVISKGIKLDFEAMPSPQISIDVDKTSLVIRNLLINAVKYTNDNGYIHVQVKPAEKHVAISFTNSGIGISEQDLPHIFTKFYRASNTSNYTRSGSGVGLALVKALTEGQGGKISVKSKLGAGSTFTLEFPALEEIIDLPHATLEDVKEHTI
jgi:two-component system sensor histidine kinase GlrK